MMMMSELVVGAWQRMMNVIEIEPLLLVMVELVTQQPVVALELRCQTTMMPSLSVAHMAIVRLLRNLMMMMAAAVAQQPDVELIVVAQ